jgi:hypothetical protein
MRVIAVEADETDRDGGDRVTLSGNEPVAEKVAFAAEITRALKLRADDPATAPELPVSVRVQEITPDALKCGALHAAVIPLGSPEVTLIVDPAAPLAAVNPPTGVAVTVT